MTAMTKDTSSSDIQLRTQARWWASASAWKRPQQPMTVSACHTIRPKWWHFLSRPTTHSTVTTTVLYRSTYISQQPQLRTTGFCCSSFTSAGSCWRQLPHSGKGEDAGVLINDINYTISTP